VVSLTPTSLPSKDYSSFTTEQEARWASELVLTKWKRNKYLASAGIQTLDHPAHSLDPKISVTTVGHVQRKKAAEVID